MAVAPKIEKAKEYSYLWEGKDKTGKIVKGEMRAPGEARASVHRK
jgi:type IV pilus assembly protein PilC